jgi:hypothetical protein
VSPQRSIFFRFPHQNPVHASPFPRMPDMPHPSQGISTLWCIISWKSVELTWWFGDAVLVLAPRGPSQSDPVFLGPVQCLLCTFKTASHIYVPNLRGRHSLCVPVNTVFL